MHSHRIISITHSGQTCLESLFLVQEFKRRLSEAEGNTHIQTSNSHSLPSSLPPSLPLSLLSFVFPSAPKGKLDAIEHNRCLGSRVSSLKALSGQMEFPLALAEETESVLRGPIVFQQLGEGCREEK